MADYSYRVIDILIADMLLDIVFEKSGYHGNYEKFSDRLTEIQRGDT